MILDFFEKVLGVLTGIAIITTVSIAIIAVYGAVWCIKNLF